jgi:signal transduction histidine kinase
MRYLSAPAALPIIPEKRPNARICRTVRTDLASTVEQFEERKRFGRFGSEDAALLTQLRPVFEKHADAVVESFYDHLLRFAPLRSLLAGDGTLDRLKGHQRKYLLSLVAGTYDESYLRDRLRIGEIHDRIGLDAEWYLGSYGFYLDLLLPLISEGFPGEPARAARAQAALSKLFMLDVQLVLDAYYGIRQKKAVEYSKQLAAVGELAASIAHEVRNPLAGMRGALQILRKELEPASQEIVGELLAQIDRLEQLVRDLLTFARPRALRRRRFDLHDLLDRLLRIHEEDSESYNITVQRSYGPGSGRVVADPDQMEQLFLNLIHNAVQSMTGGGTLKIDTRAVDGEVVVTLQDAGKGIPTGDLPKVLQPFFTTKHRGSGLGLSIVKKITEAHGGALEIRSELGCGTTVTVAIPDPGIEA